MSKRILSTMLALCMVLPLLPGAAWAEGLPEDGTLIEHLESLGPMPELDDEPALLAEAGYPITGECGADGGNVTWTLESNGTLTIVGQGNMADYTNIYMPPWYSYRNNIQSVVIGSDVTSIGNHAFYDCDGLTSVTIPNGVTSIGDDAFAGCNGLTSVIIPNSVTSIGAYAFEHCSELTSVTIPGSVTSIGAYAFEHCSGLTSVTIPNSVTSIGDLAFYDCSGLTNVTIPNSVTSIGELAFSSCRNLSAIFVNPGNTSYYSQDGVLLSEDHTLVSYPAGKAEKFYNVPASVISIGYGAFAYCDGLTSVTIPNSVTSIEIRAFAYCDSLTSVTIPNSVTSIGYRAFEWCSGLTSVTIPNSVTSIGDAAFYACKGLTSVTISNSVTSIGNGTFESCSGLTSVTIPNSVTSIGRWAFRGCSGLKDVYYSGSKAEWTAISIDDYNEELSAATIHYNSTGPNGNHDDKITFRSDNNFTVNVDDSIVILASIPDADGLQQSDITWSSSDMSVAIIESSAALIGDGLASATATIQGVAPGAATITVNISDGRSASCEVTVKDKGQGGSNISLEDFNVSIYRADLLVNRTDTPASRILYDLLGTRSPSRIFQEELYSDWSLLDAVNVWNAVCNTFDTAENPYNLYNLAFEEKDFYTAILMGILETNVSHSQVNSMEEFVETSESWIKEATSFVKLKFNINDSDNPFTEEEDKKAIADAYMEYFQKELKFATWDTDHAFLGYMDIVFKYYDSIMGTVDDLEDFADQIISAFALVAMSESTKNVVRELYANCPPSNFALRGALSDIIKTMDSSETELIAELVTDGLTIAGDKMCSKASQFFWDKAILSCVPEVKILISSYKAGKWVSDELFNTSEIAEECNKVVMTTVCETLVGATVRKLGQKFSSAKDISSADTFLKSVDIYFSVLDHSADQAVSFVDAVDGGLYQKVSDIFNPGGNASGENLKKSIESIRNSYKIQQNSLWNGWIYSLESDYPNSGLYERYNNQLIEKHERKTFQIHCPVDILLYDANDNLVAYVKDGKVHCDEDADLTLVVRGDEKEIIFYDNANYRMECVGSDAGTMDVIITEYNTLGDWIRGVYFYDMPLQKGATYETDVDDRTLGNITYQLTSTSGDVHNADLDTYNSLESTYTLNVVSGAANIGNESVFTVDLPAGQQVNITAYTPKDCQFTGWTSNIAGTAFDDATQENTTMIMPASDVVIRATIAESGYSVIFDANGGTCDTVVIATDLSGVLHALPVPSYPGYSFQGWYTDATGGNPLMDSTVLTKDITAYAHWTEGEVAPPSPNIFTITFDPVGGTVSTGTMTTGVDGKLSDLPTAACSGYTLNGWYTATSGGEQITTDHVFTSDTTLYAHWAENTMAGHTHSWATTWSNDVNGHWHNCTAADCPITTNSQKDGYTAHTSDGGKVTTAATAYQNGVRTYSCTICGYVIKAETIPATGNNGSYYPDPYYPINGGNGLYNGPSYSVSVPSHILNGTVHVSPSNARMGGTVTITVIPDSGYELVSLTVADKDSQKLELADKGSGQYTFTMPNGKVTVDAKFGLVWVSPFTDVISGAWYYEAVKFANKNGLMNGIGNGLFAPEAHLSRAMLAEILYNKESRPAIIANSTFADVEANKWYSNAVAWASGCGIADGYENGLFGPNDDITREQLAVMLYRYTGSPIPPNLSLNFSDAYKVSDWAQDAVRWAVDLGILNGKGNGILDPAGKATRAEAAQMLKNYLDK